MQEQMRPSPFDRPAKKAKRNQWIIAGVAVLGAAVAAAEAFGFDVCNCECPAETAEE